MLASASWLPPATEDPTYPIVGLLIVSLFTAAVWTVLFAATGHALGYPPSAHFLVTVGITVALNAALGFVLCAGSATSDQS